MIETQKEKVTFSFGENWLDFLPTIDAEARNAATADLDHWIGLKNIEGRSVVDIGSGSGLSSLAFRRAGCARLVSIDVDPKSVEATATLASGSPELLDGWEIRQGSILDDELVNGLGRFDIVYSWGVLHHTGSMWRALENAARMCADNGLLWISIYQGGPRYESDLALKRRYNEADSAVQNAMVEEMFAAMTAHAAATAGRGAASQTSRGMSLYHDVVDWLGGLPYEVARPGEILSFCRDRGFAPLRALEAPEGGCSIYLMRRTLESDPDAAFEYSAEGDEVPRTMTLRELRSEELRRADILYLRTREDLEARVRVWEREAAEAAGKLNSGRHLVAAAVRRFGAALK